MTKGIANQCMHIRDYFWSNTLDDDWWTGWNVRDSASLALLTLSKSAALRGLLRAAWAVAYSSVHRTDSLYSHALSGSSPCWFDMLAIKIALLSKNYFIGAPWGTRTPNLRIRSARLYPIELMALAKLTIMIIHYLIVLCQSIFLLFISLSLSVPWMESRSFLFSCRAISVCWIWECTWNTINLPYLLCPKECLFFLWCALSRWQM